MEERAAPPKPPKAWLPRLRLWLFAVLVGIVVGLCGFQETDLRALKAVLRKHKVESHVTVVAIDDRTLAAIGHWPFPRSVYARLIDRLFAMGADRVYFNFDFSLRQDNSEDAAFATALKANGNRVYLGSALSGTSFEDVRRINRPGNYLNSTTKTVNVSYQMDPSGRVSSLPYWVGIDGIIYPGLSASIAEAPSKFNPKFEIDSSIDRSSIDQISMADVLGKHVDERMIRGRPILVGGTTEAVSDMTVLLPYGRLPGTVVQALGAETLFGPLPRNLGWALCFIISATAAAFAMIPSKSTTRLIVLVLFLVGSFVIYFVTPTNITISVAPGFLILSITIAIELGLLGREIARKRATINQSSGLRNLIALRQSAADPDSHLIVGHVHNFAEAMSSLPGSAEQSLVAQISARFKFGTDGRELFNGDNGVFAWLSNGELHNICERLDGLHALFRNPVQVVGTNVDLVVTFGIDSDGERPIASRIGSALVAAAEAAALGTRWKEFDKATLADAAWKLSLLSQLDAAIDDGHLWVAYQPKLDLSTRRLVGAEALVRWTHPEKGPISPIEFVGAAEQHNRIEKLTLHVLDRAVLAAATINAHGIVFGIAVNLSTRLLENRAIVTSVRAALAAHRLPPERLTLEITETAMLTSETSLDVLADLRRIGVRISIDDYGTGLSTLEYLKKIPASEIKIDKSFVQSILAGGSDLLMVNSTIQLAHSLGHLVVAEGVESDEVLARLVELNCDLAQGYRIGRPMTFQELARRLAAERSRAA